MSIFSIGNTFEDGNEFQVPSPLPNSKAGKSSTAKKKDISGSEEKLQNSVISAD